MLTSERREKKTGNRSLDIEPKHVTLKSEDGNCITIIPEQPEQGRQARNAGRQDPVC